MPMITTILEPKVPVAPGPDQCAKCDAPLDGRNRYCAVCIELPSCVACRAAPDGEVMCVWCAESYGLQRVRQLIEWRMLIGQLDKAAGAQVLEIIEMAEERLP